MHPYEQLIRSSSDYAAAKEYDRLAEVYADDVVGWSPSYEVHSRDEFIEAVRTQNDAVNDIETDVTVDVAGEKVFMEWTWSAIIPDLEKRISLKGLSVFEIEEGRVARFRQYWDNHPIMQELGLIQ